MRGVVCGRPIHAAAQSKNLDTLMARTVHVGRCPTWNPGAIPQAEPSTTPSFRHRASRFLMLAEVHVSSWSAPIPANCWTTDCRYRQPSNGGPPGTNGSGDPA